MGAGCHYTLPDNRNIKAYWLDLSCADEEQNDPDLWAFHWDTEKEFLQDVIAQLPLATVGVNGVLYYGKYYRIEFVSTYNGDGILINLVIDGLYEWAQVYPLTLANLERVYHKIIRHVNKSTALRVATSGYTATTIAMNTF